MPLPGCIFSLVFIFLICKMELVLILPQRACVQGTVASFQFSEGTIPPPTPNHTAFAKAIPSTRNMGSSPPFTLVNASSFLKYQVSGYTLKSYPQVSGQRSYPQGHILLTLYPGKCLLFPQVSDQWSYPQAIPSATCCFQTTMDFTFRTGIAVLNSYNL